MEEKESKERVSENFYFSSSFDSIGPTVKAAALSAKKSGANSSLRPTPSGFKSEDALKQTHRSTTGSRRFYGVTDLDVIIATGWDNHRTDLTGVSPESSSKGNESAILENEETCAQGSIPHATGSIPDEPILGPEERARLHQDLLLRSKKYGAVRKKQMTTFGRRYHTLTYTVSLITLTFLLAIEGVYQWLVYSACPSNSHYSPNLKIQVASSDVEEMAANLWAVVRRRPENATAVTEAVTAVRASALELSKVVPVSLAEDRKVWLYDVYLFSACLLLYVVTAASLYRLRHHKIVRSRGRHFLVHFFCGGILLLAVMPVVSAVLCYQVFTFPDPTDIRNAQALTDLKSHIAESIFTVIIFAYFLMSNFICSAIMRQRVIYLIFKGDMTPTKAINYYLPFPLFFLITCAGLIPVFWWKYAVNWSNHYVVAGNSGMLVLAIGFSSVFVFYVFQTRNAHLQFSKFHYNIRMLIVIDLIVLAHFTTMCFGPWSVFTGVAGWSSLVRLISSFAVLDMVSCMLTQAYMEGDMPGLTMRSLFTTTGQHGKSGN